MNGQLAVRRSGGAIEIRVIQSDLVHVRLSSLGISPVEVCSQVRQGSIGPVTGELHWVTRLLVQQQPFAS